jgi:hypothetical protein
MFVSHRLQWVRINVRCSHEAQGKGKLVSESLQLTPQTIFSIFEAPHIPALIRCTVPSLSFVVSSWGDLRAFKQNSSCQHGFRILTIQTQHFNHL